MDFVHGYPLNLVLITFVHVHVYPLNLFIYSMGCISWLLLYMYMSIHWI